MMRMRPPVIDASPGENQMDDNTFLGLITLLAFVGGIGYASWQLVLLWLAQKQQDEVPLGTEANEAACLNPVPQTVAHEHYFV